tara:strand:+ start:565 stop:789 length:225 start_codon:yes stop_codon:yes gene_type:complete
MEDIYKQLKTNKIMEEENELNIDEVLYIQEHLKNDYDNINETCYDEDFVNMIEELNNKMNRIKKQLNNNEDLTF